MRQRSTFSTAPPSLFLELRKHIAEDESLANSLEQRGLKILDGALDDIGKDAIKAAAAKIVEFGKDLGPVILKTAAYRFFESCL